MAAEVASRVGRQVVVGDLGDGRCQRIAIGRGRLGEQALADPPAPAGGSAPGTASLRHVVDGRAQERCRPAARTARPGAARTWPRAPASRRPGTSPRAARPGCPGTTRSRLWRLRSTIQSHVAEPAQRLLERRSPRRLPSSSSASPTSATKRRSGQAADASGRSAARGSGPPARRTAGRPRPGRPSPSRSRPDRDPWSGSDTTGGHRTTAASSGSAGPARRAGTGARGRTGPACGLTATRSSARSQRRYSADMIDTTDADDAWWPPTLSPSTFGRTAFASWIIRAASHRTRSATASSGDRPAAGGSGSDPGSGSIAGRRSVTAIDLPYCSGFRNGRSDM